MEIRTVQSSPDIGFPSFGWFTPQRRGLAIAFFLGACAGFGVGNGHTTQGAIEHVSAQLGDAKGAVAVLQRHDNCVALQAKVATAVANQAVVSAVVRATPIPDPSVIPDCPPPPKVKVR